jgi:hypothetical protein
MPVITYEQQRLEYFKQRKAECERKLEWYQNRKTVSVMDETMRLDKCTEYGKKISFYTDAIKAFGGDGK